MKKSKKRVIPGFGLTMGVTITMLSTYPDNKHIRNTAEDC